MAKDVLVLTCKRCGEDFLYEFSGKGSKPKYCEKCRPILVSEAKQRYIEKQRKKRIMGDVEVGNNIELITNTIKDTADYIVNKHSKPSEMDEKYDTFVNEISRLLMQLDSTRVELCNISKQLYSYQSDYDKNDQAFLHKLEDMETLDSKEATRFLNEWKASRKDRRNMKNLIAVIGNAIDAIPYKNYTNALPILRGSAYYKYRGNEENE